MQVCNRFLVKSWSFCGTNLKMREWVAYLLTGNLLGAFSTLLIIADIVYTYNIGGSDQPIFMDKPGSSHLEVFGFCDLSSPEEVDSCLFFYSYFSIDFIKV